MSVFLMVAIIVVAGVTAQSVAQWTDARSAERRTRERYALLAKLAEQPRESAEVVIALLREEDAKDERRRMEPRPVQRQAQRTHGMKAGLMLVAIGAGLAFFIAGLDTSGERVWPIGLVPILMGLVLFGFAYFSKADSSQAEWRRSEGVRGLCRQRPDENRGGSNMRRPARSQRVSRDRRSACRREPDDR